MYRRLRIALQPSRRGQTGPVPAPSGGASDDGTPSVCQRPHGTNPPPPPLRRPPPSIIYTASVGPSVPQRRDGGNRVLSLSFTGLASTGRSESSESSRCGFRAQAGRRPSFKTVFLSPFINKSAVGTWLVCEEVRYRRWAAE